MNFKSKFLTLSMKEQICITIIFLSAFSVLVILCLCCSFCYEILKEDYKQKRICFFDKYKELVEASFNFQNFCLLQYEEIIKRMQKQIYKYHRNSTTGYRNFKSNYKADKNINLVPYFNSTEHKNIQEDNDQLFFFCYNTNKNICKQPRDIVINFYDSISSIIFSHDINKHFHIPGYNLPILKSPLVVNYQYKLIFSFNGSYIYQHIKDRGSNYTDMNTNYYRGNLDIYYYRVVENMKNNSYYMLLYYTQNYLFLFDQMFEKANIEMNSLDELSIINFLSDGNVNMYSLYQYAMAASGYYSSVIFPNNKFSLISLGSNNLFYYFEAQMIENYLFFLLERLSDFLDISFIPLHYENNTIISPELCLSFLLKQYKYQLDKDEIDELYKKIKKGESNITECFINKNILIDQLEIKDIFNLNISYYMLVDNKVYQGLISTKKDPIYFIKYTYPNYNVLKEFRSDYLLLNQINFYLFYSFKDPIVFSDFVFQIYKNLSFFIITLILYTWVFCLAINLIIFSKVIVQLTEPIKKLQEAIESSSVKDENIFNYEYDIFINDLFLTCKELLSGQIDNNNHENGLGQFNILSIPSDNKDIDKNLYQRNLRIDNNIMNQLINEQQNMMDFSKNIKINEALNINSDSEYQNIKKENSFLKQNNIILNSNDNNDKDTLSLKHSESKGIIKLNKINEEEDREPYKKLFKISEYLFYYQNKVENNFISLVNNVIKDESKKSNISKISNNINNFNGSLKISGKLKKQIKRGDSNGKSDDNENFTINMLNNRNISYFWYMEAKKKKNKSINYQIGDNYDELFSDNNSYQIIHEPVKKII